MIAVTTFFFFTAVAVTLAAGSSVVAWRLLRGRDRRAAAPLPTRPTDNPGVAAECRPRSPGPDIAPALIAVAAVIAAGAVLALPDTTLPPEAASTTAPAAPPPDVRRSPASGATLELVQLSEVVAGGTLTVSGRVHNPPHAPLRRGLSAVILLVDAEGEVIHRGRTPLGAIEPGATGGFTVALAPGAAAARYRIGFQDGTTVVPHVDRRSRRRTDRAIATAAPLPTRGRS